MESACSSPSVYNPAKTVLLLKRIRPERRGKRRKRSESKIKDGGARGAVGDEMRCGLSLATGVRRGAEVVVGLVHKGSAFWRGSSRAWRGTPPPSCAARRCEAPLPPLRRRRPTVQRCGCPRKRQRRMQRRRKRRRLQLQQLRFGRSGRWACDEGSLQGLKARACKGERERMGEYWIDRLVADAIG